METTIAEMIFDGFSDQEILEYAKSEISQIRKEFDSKLAPRSGDSQPIHSAQ